MKRRGFTLVEVLVVIGIIILLAGIFLPMLSRASKTARKNAIAADLQAISQALDAYMADFGALPKPGRLPNGGQFIDGPTILCWALVAPGPAREDGKGDDPTNIDVPGPGFRLRGVTGTVKGPYLPADRFRVGYYQNAGLLGKTVVPPNGNTYSDYRAVLGDRNGNVILYFHGTTKWVAPFNGNYFANQPGAYDGGESYRWNAADVPNTVASPADVQAMFGADANGNVDTVKGKEAILAPYVLISAGDADRFGDKDNVANVPLQNQ